MTDGDKRRCPWCWEWIDRSATRCQHCNKEVRPTGQRPAPDLPNQAGAQGGTAQPVSTERQGQGDTLPDLSTATGQIMWWGTALLLYGVLLFGVALVYPAPRGIIAFVLLVVQLGAAYLVNRALWSRLKSCPMSRVIRTIVILGAVVVVLMLLGWVRRQFLT